MWLKITFATTFLYALILLKNYAQGADATDNDDRTATKEESSDDSKKHNEQSVIEIRNDKEFTEMMEQHCAKLVLVDYTASWCGPCRFIAPHLEEFASQYPDITFLKVDVDECKGTANSQGVQAMPTFIFYRHMKRVKRQVGANKDTLVTTIRELSARKPEDPDLSPLLLVHSECECLNDTPDHNFTLFLMKADHYLESVSDDPKLIMSFVFTQPVSLYSLRINAPSTNGPKTIKLYVNPPKAINFEDAANEMKWTQTIQLKPADLTGESVDLICPHFHVVQRLQIFVESNHNSSEQTATRIDNLVFKGEPAEASANIDEESQERRQRGRVGHFFSDMSTKFTKLVSPSKSSAGGESKN